MNSAQYDRMERLFEEACALPPQERSAFLEDRCPDDSEVLRKVQELLACDAEADLGLDWPALGEGFRVEAPRTAELPEYSGYYATQIRLGDRVGPYVIREQIGEGGFAVVYAAQQTEPVRRQVAIKVIKAGMDTGQVIARFEAERQALALMDHPNVARVFDAGATETGRPYFVMEHVAGTPITEYCDRQRLDIDGRLHLFMQVCEAVQHAHQKGIIHRDVKPSNVLVAVKEGRPLAKVIDFGVAKAINQRLTERTIFTEQGQFIGTPEYMSPEQAEMTMDNIDTRCDIYSLGVLLYELLTGALPLDRAALRAAGFAEIQRIIREESPPRPSSRLSRLGGKTADFAGRRRLDPRTLLRALRGDLDWITMKALEKDRTRRYGTAAELAADIRRHLDHLPVSAGPPGAAYRAAKFVRRHRVGVFTTVALVLTLVAGVIATTWQAVRATRAQQAEAEQRRVAQSNEAQALAEAGKSREIAGFIQEMLAGVDPAFAQGKDTVLLRRILDDTSKRIETELAGQPEVEAAIRDTIGRTYQALGAYTLAQPHLERALDTRRRVLGDDHPDTLNAINSMGELLFLQGKLSEAEPYLREALEGRRRVLGDDHADTLFSINNMGAVLYTQGKSADAEPYFRDGIESYRRVLGNDHPETLNAINNLGFVLQAEGKLSEAEPYIREAMDGYRRVLGNDHPQTLNAISNMGFLLRRQGKLADAGPYVWEALETRRRVLGDDHPDTMASIDNMGALLKAQGQLAEAEPYYRHAMEGRRRVLGDDHPTTLGSINNMGALLEAQGKPAEAEPYVREAMGGYRRVHGDDHPDTLTSITWMGHLLQAQGRLAEAEPYFAEALRGRRRVLGDDHPDTLISIGNLGDLFRAQGRLDDAEAYCREAVEKARRALPQGHWQTGLFLWKYGQALAQLQRQEEAEAALLEANQILSAALGAGDVRIVRTVDALAALYDAWSKPGQAAEWRAKLPTPQEPLATD